MAKQLFKFNHRKMDFTPVTMNAGRVLLVILKYFAISLFFAVLYYIVFSLFYDTPEEKALSEENRYLSRQYRDARRRIDLLEETSENIWLRDISIYREVYNSELPDYVLESSRNTGLDYSRIYSDGESEILSEMVGIVSRSEKTAQRVTDNMNRIFELLGRGGVNGKGIPSSAPVRDFAIGQTGASVGMKINPFSKTLKKHEGMDIVAPSGTAVLAAADGVVASVDSHGRRDGFCVTIRHSDGFSTEYKHIDSILVRSGQNVRRGTPIATVGTSGKSFAPHLHYEVIRNEKRLDPVHFFFSDLGPADYNDIAILGLITGQSLD